ncbi:SPX domain-containing protein 3 [Aristolochia californica]|uniref:SPX domain-containing protein 3 n=1 Tax=Aristolochia californica TaxID=171875 RepID=UPI0035E0EA21
MKFGKWLKQQIEESLPEWRDEFLYYKDLKKLVNLISAATDLAEYAKAEADFRYLLNAEIAKFNAFVVEQEEDFIIRQKEIQERLQTINALLGTNGVRPSEAEYREEMRKIIKDIVDFHGEMVLLMNYSVVNYTGLSKIAKKYDKRTGRPLRLPFIKTVLEQPFFTTSMISKLVKECENTVDVVFHITEEEDNGYGDIQLNMTEVATEQTIFKNTVAALKNMKEMRRTSSTYSPLSLPPLNLPEFDFVHSFQLQSPVSIL